MRLSERSAPLSLYSESSLGPSLLLLLPTRSFETLQIAPMVHFHEGADEGLKAVNLERLDTISKNEYSRNQYKCHCEIT